MTDRGGVVFFAERVVTSCGATVGDGCPLKARGIQGQREEVCCSAFGGNMWGVYKGHLSPKGRAIMGRGDGLSRRAGGRNLWGACWGQSHVATTGTAGDEVPLDGGVAPNGRRLSPCSRPTLCDHALGGPLQTRGS